MAITIGLLLLIAYSHYEIGLYKYFYNDVELHLLYMIFTVGILHSSNISGGGITTVTYLVPLNMLTFLSCKRLLMWKKKRVATRRFIMIDSPRDMEEHIVYLIQLIDCIHLRENKLILEGYIQYHRRECRIGE